MKERVRSNFYSCVFHISVCGELRIISIFRWDRLHTYTDTHGIVVVTFISLHFQQSPFFECGGMHTRVSTPMVYLTMPSHAWYTVHGVCVGGGGGGGGYKNSSNDILHIKIVVTIFCIRISRCGYT